MDTKTIEGVQFDEGEQRPAIPNPTEIRKFAFTVAHFLAKRTADERFNTFEARDGLTAFLTAILLMEAQKRSAA